MPLERQIVANIIKKAKKRPHTWARKIYSHGYSGGWPDILIVQYGRACFVEAKQGGKLPTERQLAELETWRRAGAEAIVATCWEDVEPVLDAML